MRQISEDIIKLCEQMGIKHSDHVFTVIAVKVNDDDMEVHYVTRLARPAAAEVFEYVLKQIVMEKSN